MVNRATKEIRNLEEAIRDSRGCFDLDPLPNFSLKEFPYCLAKGRKGVSLLNIATLESFVLTKTPEM